MNINYQELEKEVKKELKKRFPDQFTIYTFPEACALLNINMDKLRFQCVLNCILPSKYDGEYGLSAQDFRTISNALHGMKVYKTSNENPWA